MIQELIVNGRLEWVASYILEQENDDNPYLDRKIAINNFFKYAVIDIDETSEIVEIAKVTRTNGLKTKDSLHFACAVSTGCDYLITTDKQFLNYKNDRIKLLNPMQFIIEMEELLYD